MSHIKFLEFVSSELGENSLKAQSLDAFLAVERAWKELDMSNVSRHAAQLTTLFPSLPLERIEDEFGQEIASICKDLHPISALESIPLKAASLLDKHRVVQDAALAVIAAEISSVEARDQKVLLDVLSSMSADVQGPLRLAFLKELRKRLAKMCFPKKEAREDTSRVISISIDVCASTKAKSRMREHAQCRSQLLEWYKHFQNCFLVRESNFYKSLLASRKGQFVLDWNRAFVVKGIGDEIWFLYEITENENWKLPAVVNHLLHAALDTLRHLVSWSSASCSNRVEEENDSEMDELWESAHLPMKIYVDIIDVAYDYTSMRRDLITKLSRNILDENKGNSYRDLVELGNRLNAGVLEMDGRRLVTTIRSDFVGWEVDRYFRMTKYALPCVVSVGRDLFEETLGDSIDNAKQVSDTNLFRAEFPYKYAEGPSISYEHSFHFVKEEIPAKCLKGTGEGYALYHVLRKHDLLDLYCRNADQGTLCTTHKVFTRDMVHAMRSKK